MKHHQQGLALVTALLVIAIATVVATRIFYQQQINLRRTYNQLQAEQIWQLFRSAEQWGKVILREDLIANNYDSFNDTWAQALPPIAAEGGLFQAAMTDYQGCFNINNLVIAGQIQQQQVTIFKNLLSQKELNENLVWSLIDWLDADDEPNPQGAEWETYSLRQPPYRAANQALTDIQELYAVAHWGHEQITALAADICALPTAPAYTELGRYFPAQTEASPLNINTISLLLLKSLSVEMSAAKLDNVIKAQQQQGFKSVAEFFAKLDQENPQQPKLSSTLNRQLLSVSSFYFMLHYTGWIGNLEQQYQSLLYRNNKQINTLYRTRFY
ncbi:MAG: general secretion pathway protein K [Methyloprofundus sp.]|nr:MAG: general secretion pathway protein K [Methyloprofundus sp.]